MHISRLNSADYRTQALADRSQYLYLTVTKTDQVSKLNLLTGVITLLQGRSKTGYPFYVSSAEDLVLSVSTTIDAWQLSDNTLHKLDHLETAKDYMHYSLVSNRHLVSDGRIWNFDNGQVSHSGLSATAVLNDGIYLQTAYNYDVLRNLGFDENYGGTYGLAAHAAIDANGFYRSAFQHRYQSYSCLIR